MLHGIAKPSAAIRIDYVEFSVNDVQQAKGFYGEVFGWTFDSFVMEAGYEYTVAKTPEAAVVGMSPVHVGPLNTTQAYWLSTVEVDDIDAAVAKASELVVVFTDANLYRAAAYTLKTDDSLHVSGTFRHLGTSLSFYNATSITKPTVTGFKGANAALTSLLTALVNLGLITDSSSSWRRIRRCACKILRAAIRSRH